MTPESIMTLAVQALRLGLMVAGPLLLGALLTGLIVSILQAATQINEMTMTFIPKILVMVGLAILLGPWMLHHFIDFTRELIVSIPTAIG